MGKLHFNWADWSDDGRWLNVGPRLSHASDEGVAVAWMMLGADSVTPFRPWPQVGLERRGEHGHMALGWVVWFGLGLCIQTMLPMVILPSEDVDRLTHLGEWLDEWEEEHGEFTEEELRAAFEILQEDSS